MNTFIEVGPTLTCLYPKWYFRLTFQNNCRLCPKAFCCKKCRCEHETEYHNVISQCDICIYGTFVFENIDESILQHIKETHLPLNCLYCKRVFSCIEEIIQHRKCPVYYKEDSPKTPLFKPPEILVSVEDQDSPILQELQRIQALNFIFKLATSTPMQNTEQENFDKSKDDASTSAERSQISNKSIIKKTQTLRKSDESSKRRVTFSDTPGSNFSIEYNNHVLQIEQTYSIKTPQISEDVTSNTGRLCTPTMEIKAIPTEEFYSAKSEINRSSVKVHASRNDGNKTSMMNPEDISTPVCIPKQSETVRQQLDIYKDNDASNQIQSDNNCEASPEIKQQITENNGSLIEISSSISEGEQMVPSESSKFFNTELSKSESLYTPKMVIPTETFYSAKSEVDNCCTKGDHLKSQKSLLQCDDISTPVCVPKSAQGVRVKVEMDAAEDTKEDIADQTSCKISNFFAEEFGHEMTNINEISMEMCTPLLIDAVSKQQIVSTNAKVQISPDAKLQLNDSSNIPNKIECDRTDDSSIYTPASQTLWHSATNLEQNDLHEDKENIPPKEDKKHVDLVKETQERRVSIVMPTPVLKRTDVHMKIRLPVHFASTPVTSNHEVMSGPVRAMENFGSKVSLETPYKTPQATCSHYIGMKTFGSGMEPSTIEANPYSIEEQFGLSSEEMHKETPQIRQLPGYQRINGKQNIAETSANFTSTSSMTESNLWRSMTRAVRSVLGLAKKNEQCSVNIVSRSFKRQLSDEEMEVFESPQPKRFKYTDIKCRKPIRSVLVPSFSSEVATFKFVGSVSTIYNCATKTKCDKYTQTDDYLMYAWFSSTQLQ